MEIDSVRISIQAEALTSMFSWLSQEITENEIPGIAWPFLW
jgi:hypothetical protein